MVFLSKNTNRRNGERRAPVDFVIEIRRFEEGGGQLYRKGDMVVDRSPWYPDTRHLHFCFEVHEARGTVSYISHPVHGYPVLLCTGVPRSSCLTILCTVYTGTVVYVAFMRKLKYDGMTARPIVTGIYLYYEKTLKSTI